jgi:hypothetical protein
MVGHSPPYTLRHGGTKSAECACLMHPSFGWRSWKLEFGDVLLQDGVIDGRGVVNSTYGTRNGENGTLKGYGVRAFRFWGESGKVWHQEQRLARKGIRKARGKTTQQAKPEEVVMMSWKKPFSVHTREYHFSWRGFEFIWKGTRKTDPSLKKVFRPFLRLCHLKCVVLVPQKAGQGEKEILLARFTSVISKRKVGRFEIHEDILDAFLEEGFLRRNAEEMQDEGVVSGDWARKEKLRQRLRDVVVGMGMCMVIEEWRKRQVVIGIIVAILDSIP